MFKRILASLIILLTSLSSIGADKWSIGFNEPFIAGYMKSRGHYCADCPTNSYQADIPLITNRLLDLASQRHVGAFREIIPLEALRPTSTVRHHEDVIDVISIYSNFNLKLVITLGLPVPVWMAAPMNSGWKPMPVSDSNWSLTKDRIAYETADLIRSLWNSPRVSRAWMSSHLYVEGFNEFDSLQNPSGSTASATPGRAADLQNGIQWYLNNYGINVQTLMPSVVGVYEGYGIGVDRLRQYVIDYYQANGSGLPNVHIYVRNDSPPDGYQALLNKLRERVVTIDQALPLSLKGSLVIGETGAADRVPSTCSASSDSPTLDISQRDSYYAAAAFDSEISSRTKLLLFWRLMNLPLSQLASCEAYFGAVHDDNSGYKGVGLNLFNYLSN